MKDIFKKNLLLSEGKCYKQLYFVSKYHIYVVWIALRCTDIVADISIAQHLSFIWYKRVIREIGNKLQVVALWSLAKTKWYAKKKTERKCYIKSNIFIQASCLGSTDTEVI